MGAFGKLCVGFVLFCGFAGAQAVEEDYRAYTEQPRLFLRPQRLRLLKRERERQSIRWEQFQALMGGKAQMGEPGFASALYYSVTGDRDSGQRAVEWAVGGADIRQVAIVYDWCQSLMSAAQNKTIAARLTKAASVLAAKSDFVSMRDRAFAAVAIADVDPNASSAALRDIVQNAWRKRALPILKEGAGLPVTEQVHAMYEMMHAIRDNLNIDLRDDFPAWFKTIPQVHLLSHYPAPYPAPENEYRIPAFDGDSAPDLRRAALSRAAELSMVAYDVNAAETQFIQGWLMQDRFLLRSTFGITYEYMWANPYQPGVSYFHLPLAVHDPRSGSLFVRSSWDEDALWLGRVGADWQTFKDGKITVLNTQKRRDPVVIGETQLFVARDALRFDLKQAAARAYVLGLKVRATYEVEVDDEEMHDAVTDGAGTLEVPFPPETTTTFRLAATK
jgi:hypothetical protein